MFIDNSKTYIGIVEDNLDPKRLGRCRIRVVDVFDDIPVSDIPWASPWKDMNGNSSNVPERGKVLTVIFDSGNIYKPEYIYSEHYNINLEKKLQSLSNKNYLTMKSLIFDHKTQIYVNDEEGLKLDHKFNNINIIKQGIDLNLKDNFGKVNIGDSNPDQQAILGTNYMNWMDDFINHLAGLFGGPFVGHNGAPVIATPGFIEILNRYYILRDPKFLSKNVYLNDNGEVNSIRTSINIDPNLRINDPSLGDNWKSTVSENEMVVVDDSDFTPQYGTGDETPDVRNPDGSPGSLTNSDDVEESPPIDAVQTVGDTNPDVNKILNAMRSKKYTINESPFYLNIVSIRYQYEGQEYSNKFKDRLWAIWKNDEGQWESKNWAISTLPGLLMDWRKKLKMKKWCSTNRKKGLGILVPAQYVNIYKFEEASSSKGMKSKPYFRSVGKQLAYRDIKWDSDIITYSNKENLDSGNHGMFIHRGWPGGVNVNNWSEGCQVFSKESDYDQFCNLSRFHIQKNSNSFNYSLLMSNDI